MKGYQRVYPVKLVARVLSVSRSVLKTLINYAHTRSRGTYGPRRLQDELAAEKQQVGRDNISRLRKEMGLKCIQHKKFKVTTDSKHDLPVDANLLE
jgi:putative transposase